MLKSDKPYYQPGLAPAEIRVPPMGFIELAGAGRPDSPDFAEKVAALYSLAYTVRMAPRNGLDIPGYHEFTVYPLEGIWDLNEAGRNLAQAGFGIQDKANLVYRLMIRQPEFVEAAVFPAILDAARRKKPNPQFAQVNLIRLEEGLCVQMTHIGPFDSEPASFARMGDYCAAHNLRRLSHVHREIYMSDPRRTPPESLRTVLRWMVERVPG
jgi:hypothetical protein